MRMADWMVVRSERFAISYWSETDNEVVRDEWGNLKPKLVRQPTNTQILDSLLALKTEQRFLA